MDILLPGLMIAVIAASLYLKYESRTDFLALAFGRDASMSATDKHLRAEAWREAKQAYIGGFILWVAAPFCAGVLASAVQRWRQSRSPSSV